MPLLQHLRNRAAARDPPDPAPGLICNVSTRHLHADVQVDVLVSLDFAKPAVIPPFYVVASSGSMVASPALQLPSSCHQLTRQPPRSIVQRS